MVKKAPSLHEVGLLPELSVLALSPGQRAISSLMSMQTAAAPKNAGETDLAGDLFNSLFSDPEKMDPAPAERATNAAVLDWMAASEHWQTAVANSRGNLPVALSTTNLLWSMATTDEVVSKALERQAAVAEQQQQARQRRMRADLLQSIQHPEARAALRQAAAAEREADENLSQLAEQLRGLRENPINDATIKQAVGSATKEAAAVAGAMAGWSMDPGSPALMDPRQALATLKRLSPKIRQIAEVVGRVRGIANSARMNRVARGPLPTAMTITRDPLSLLPSELAQLSPAAPVALRALKTAAFADRGLLGWRKTRNPNAAGDFVAEVDGSGSMEGVAEIVAKGLALGLGKVAQQEGRQYTIESFATSRDKLYTVDSAQSWAQHLDWAEQFQAGGTDFDFAVGRLIQLLSDLPASRRERADALLITDGYAQLTPKVATQWRDFQAANGVRLMVVLITDDPQEGEGDELLRLATKVMRVGDLEKFLVEITTEAATFLQ